MPLRNNGEVVRVLRIGAPALVTLAEAHPEECEEDASARRAALVQSAGGRASPRVRAPLAIQLPVPVRTQSALYHQLPRSVQAQLNGAGSQKLARSRKELHTGNESIVRLKFCPENSLDEGDED